MRLFAAFFLGTLLIGGGALAEPSHSGTQVAGLESARSDVERIRAGARDCRGCDLKGADLSNQCVKGGDLRGANFEGAKAPYMCMSHANFAGANFRNADLTGANLGHSDLTGADLTGAVLDITNIRGADLSRSFGLTQFQLDMACGDTTTNVPAGLAARSCI
ncbi:MAG: pentapeptide repeat-containing protein [Alphaproteobacteria bacterium]